MGVLSWLKDKTMGTLVADHGELIRSRAVLADETVDVCLTHKGEQLFVVTRYRHLLETHTHRLDVGPGAADALRRLADDIDAFHARGAGATEGDAP